MTTDAEGNVTVVKKPVVGANIRGNVYGGGNNAGVTGNTNVTIGKETTTTSPSTSDSSTPDSSTSDATDGSNP